MFVFFFNVPATTEIYTYLHTLSLHDALPISLLALVRAIVDGTAEVAADRNARVRDPRAPGHVVALRVRRRAADVVALVVAGHQLHRQVVGEVRGPGQRRSEEHTSELQSLMRISYAVFCLKTKTSLL